MGVITASAKYRRKTFWRNAGIARIPLAIRGLDQLLWLMHQGGRAGWRSRRCLTQLAELQEQAGILLECTDFRRMPSPRRETGCRCDYVSGALAALREWAAWWSGIKALQLII